MNNENRSDTVIRVVDLWKHYDDDEQNGVQALRGVSMEVRRGEVIALFGKSGSGKSTLLNMIAGLDMPTRGAIEIAGRSIESLGESGRTLLRRTAIGFVFQFFNLLPTLTVFENVHLASELAGKPNIAGTKKMIADLGLRGKENRYPHEISGGEQQRVAIARALVKEPLLVLADEPTGNLDTATGEAILNILTARCREGGMSLLMVTHTPAACDYADRILTMVDGTIQPDYGHEA
jgi:putative ABC transport system ATP-binding protein